MSIVIHIQKLADNMNLVVLKDGRCRLLDQADLDYLHVSIGRNWPHGAEQLAHQAFVNRNAAAEAHLAAKHALPVSPPVLQHGET